MTGDDAPRRAPAIPGPRPASEPSHEALADRLSAAGWVLVGGHHQHADHWRSPSRLVHILVPTDPSRHDYGAGLAEAWAIWGRVLADAGHTSR